MAKATDSPIGFPSPSKGPEPGIPPLHDLDLSELHAWQASPAGLIATHVTGLASTTAELKSLSANPVLFRLLAAELADLELVQTEIDQLISRIHRTQGVAA